MLDFMKVEVKTNSSMAKALRLQEKKRLSLARTLLVMSNGEYEAGNTKEQEEDKKKSDAYYDLYQNLRQKRVVELRRVQRHLLLAYAFLRGFAYSGVEQSSYEKPDFDEIELQVFKHMPEDADPREVKQKFEEWAQLSAQTFKIRLPKSKPEETKIAA